MDKKILILGAGRMGVRHATGCLDAQGDYDIVLADQKQEALDEAGSNLKNHTNAACVTYSLVDNIEPGDFDIGIIAATAAGRRQQLELVYEKGCNHILIEKPLGQSMQQVQDLMQLAETNDAKVHVNLSMRLYEGFIQLKKDLLTMPQMIGPKVISINTGAIGISSNGIHYLDLIYHLLDAKSAEIEAAAIDDEKIPSGRGTNFTDFGGWATIHYYDDDHVLLARAHLSMSATSSVLGGWDIIGPHGKITINEIDQQRIDTLRDPDSAMPVNRYAADYQPRREIAFVSPELSTLTTAWINSIGNENILPDIGEAVPAHQLMFDWLATMKGAEDTYPIT